MSKIRKIRKNDNILSNTIEDLVPQDHDVR